MSELRVIHRRVGTHCAMVVVENIQTACVRSQQILSAANDLYKTRLDIQQRSINGHAHFTQF